MIVMRWIGLILWTVFPVICLAGPSDVTSPLTVHQKSRGTIPLITDAGADTNIPLAIRPKGNSYLQLGPNTYGVSGWAGSDVATELYNQGTATGNSYGNYVDVTAGDFESGSLFGNEIFIYSKNNATNNTDQLIGIDATTLPYLPLGKTMRQAVGIQGQIEAHNAGIIENAYGIQGFVTAEERSHINVALAVNGAVGSLPTSPASIDIAVGYQSVLGNLAGPGVSTGIYYLAASLTSIPMAECYGFYITDLTETATNPFDLWFNSPGVFNMTASGEMSYYNPSFSHYTVGAANYERSIQRWNSNVLEYGTQAGGTGTLRGVRIIGASLQTPDLTAPTVKLTPGLEPSSPTEGMIYANSSDHHLYFYNGTTWKQLDN